MSADRLDQVEQSLLNLLKKLQSRKGFADVRGNRTAWAALGKFLVAIPADHREKAKAFFDDNDYEWPSAKKGRKS